jgi:hypothetical protein
MTVGAKDGEFTKKELSRLISSFRDLRRIARIEIFIKLSIKEVPSSKHVT